MPWARSFLGFQPASTDTKVPRSVVSCCLPCRRLVTRVACVVPRLFIVVNVVFVVFHPQQATRERARRREVVPIVWRISFSRRRGRVARGKPLGLVLLPYAGRVAGAATGADVAARAVATSRRLAARWAVRPCRPALWVSRPGCRRPRRYPDSRWPSGPSACASSAASCHPGWRGFQGRRGLHRV